MNSAKTATQTRIITGPPIQHGEWTLRTQTKQISRQGKNSVRLQEKPLAVLLNNSEETRYIPVPDITRLVQMSLLGGCIALFLVLKFVKLK